MGLRSKLAKKFKATTDTKHNHQVLENVLNRDFEPNNLSEAWSVGYHLYLCKGRLFIPNNSH